MFSCNLGKYKLHDVQTCALSPDFLKQNPAWEILIKKYKIFNILEPRDDRSGSEQGDRDNSKDAPKR